MMNARLVAILLLLSFSHLLVAHDARSCAQSSQPASRPAADQEPQITITALVDGVPAKSRLIRVKPGAKITPFVSFSGAPESEYVIRLEFKGIPWVPVDDGAQLYDGELASGEELTLPYAGTYTIGAWAESEDGLDIFTEDNLEIEVLEKPRHEGIAVISEMTWVQTLSGVTSVDATVLISGKVHLKDIRSHQLVLWPVYQLNKKEGNDVWNDPRHPLRHNPHLLVKNAFEPATRQWHPELADAQYVAGGQGYWKVRFVADFSEHPLMRIPESWRISETGHAKGEEFQFGAKLVTPKEPYHDPVQTLFQMLARPTPVR